LDKNNPKKGQEVIAGTLEALASGYGIAEIAITRTVPVVPSEFGENAALMGSFSLILERILLLEELD
jgi:hypothetical protein